VTMPLDALEKLGRVNERLRIDNAELRSMNKKLMRRSGGFAIDGAVDELRVFLETNPDSFQLTAPPTKYKLPKLRHMPPFNATHTEMVAKAWSDWHVSETIRAADSNGVNEYGSVIASNRIWEDTQKSKRIVTGHQALYPLTELWVMVLGDMINGSIHEELKLTNDLLDVPATVLAANLMILGIEEYKTLGLPIQIDCVIGNHPRTTLKMPTKRQAHLSMDYLVYEMVANRYSRDDQVKVNVHTGQIAIVEKLGHRYVLEHGIGVASGQEDNLEDRLRGVYDDATYRKATGLKGTSFDQVVIGNMHKPKWLERTIVNGALTGQNELGVSWRLKTIKAQQFLWGITEEHVRTWQYAVDTTHIRSKKAENPFSEFATWFMKRHGR
jgi:hypothetical protein